MYVCKQKAQKINPRQICRSKKIKILRQLHQKIKTARHRQPLKKMRLQGPRKLAKILRDPNFLKDHLPTLI